MTFRRRVVLYYWKGILVRTRYIAYVLMAMLAAAVTGCTSTEVRETRELAINHVDLSMVHDGTYDGDFTYAVRVSVTDHRIASINVVTNRDTTHAKKAEGVVGKVLDQQRNDVDVVSGATTTSKALLKAVENAITKGVSR